MREYLDAILEFIGTESLSDEEFETIELEDMSDQVAIYFSLLTVIESRELVSDTASRLLYYFQAKGISISMDSSLPTSNIFVGAPIDED